MFQIKVLATGPITTVSTDIENQFTCSCICCEKGDF